MQMRHAGGTVVGVYVLASTGTARAHSHTPISHTHSRVASISSPVTIEHALSQVSACLVVEYVAPVIRGSNPGQVKFFYLNK